VCSVSPELNQLNLRVSTGNLIKGQSIANYVIFMKYGFCENRENIAICFPALNYNSQLLSRQSSKWCKLFFFTIVRCVLFHQTNAAYVNIGLITEVYIQYTTFGVRTHVFQDCPTALPVSYTGIPYSVIDMKLPIQFVI
jgi:hypothetical protein